MNRLVLIGNGFDIAHGLKTSYANFIDWYWEQRVAGFEKEFTKTSEDALCTLNYLGKETWSGFHVIKTHKHVPTKDIVNEILNNTRLCKIISSTFFANIQYSVQTKKWVDIENEYYRLLTEYALNEEEDEDEKIDELNNQLYFIQDKLIDYLRNISINENMLKSDIKQKIYAPFKQTDISIEGQKHLKTHIEMGLNLKDNDWDIKLSQFQNSTYLRGYVEEYKNKFNNEEFLEWDNVPVELLLPNQVMLLNFNYTHIADLYCKKASIFTVNQIHGDVNNPDSVIFGYGDELDEDYKDILNLNDNRLLTNIKSVKYLETDNYRKMLSFIESEPYQILVMGHSCGNSDRTMLNTLFEHKNCTSIKPFYYIRNDGSDNYLDLIQNIHRNFTDMPLMRDRVVNKEYCEPLTQ